LGDDEEVYMTEITDPVPGADDLKRVARKKENNPFSEEEKHGDESKRRDPGEEYQGDPSVQRRAPGEADDPDADSDEEDERNIA
jgi:hypothetical protein